MPAKRDQHGDLYGPHKNSVDNLGDFAKPYLAPGRRRRVTSVSIRDDERALLALLAEQPEESAWHPDRSRVTLDGQLVSINRGRAIPTPRGNVSRGVSVLLERFAAACELLSGQQTDEATAFFETVPQPYLTAVFGPKGED